MCNDKSTKKKKHQKADVRICGIPMFKHGKTSVNLQI